MKTTILDTHCYREHVIRELYERFSSVSKEDRERILAIFKYGVDFGYHLAEQDQSQPS